MSEPSDRTVAPAIGSLPELAADVFEHSSEGMFVIAHDGIIIAVNRAFTRITGYPTEEVLGRSAAMLGSRHQDDEFFEFLRATLAVSSAWRGEVISRRKSGELIAGWMTVAAVRDAASGTVLRYVAIFSDVTAFKMADARLRHLAQHDFLTGLANRLLLEDRFEHALLRARRFQTAMAVLVIDLDGFKRVNDTCGHAVGDGLLVQVADRLRACVRQTDTAARLGGDEFVVVLPDLLVVSEAERVAREIVVSLSCLFVIDGTDVRVTASVGVGGFPDHGNDRQTLLRVADAAMYTVKRGGGNGVRFALPIRPPALLVWDPAPSPMGWVGTSPRAPKGSVLFGRSDGSTERTTAPGIPSATDADSDDTGSDQA